MWWPRPGTNIDVRRAAKIGRGAVIAFASYSGVIFAFLPFTVRTGNASLVREILPLPLWGTVWLVCAAVLCTRRREAGYAMLTLTWILYGVGSGATVFTGRLDAPLAPFMFFTLAALAWWLRARAIRRSAGTLLLDDIELPDD